MDILDLSVGEKKNRRKAQLPQRRQNVVLNRVEIDFNSESSQSDLFDNQHNSETATRQSYSDSDLLMVRDASSLENLATPEYDGGRFTPNVSGFHSPAHLGDDNITKSNEAVTFNFGEDQRLLKRPNFSETLIRNTNNSNNNNNSSNKNSNNSSIEVYNDSKFDPVKMFKKFPVNPNLAKNYCGRINGDNSHMFASKNKMRSGEFKASRSADDVQPRDMPGIPERTKKQNRWAFNVWREWARKRNIGSCELQNEYNVPLDVGKASETELDHWLSKFVKEVRRKDGNPYPPHTLMQIVMGIQRYLRQQAGRPSICILDRSNPTYSGFRAVLDTRIKELTNDGVTSGKTGRKNSILPLSGKSLQPSSNSSHYPEESALWEAGILGFDTALGLLNAVFFHNTVSFGIRTIDDHWNLKIRHFELGGCGEKEYVEFLPTRDTTFVKRGMSQDKRIYAEVSNPRCPVKIYQKYMSLVSDDGAFYRHPQEPTLVDRTMRFSDQWIGKNRLRAMIKHIFDTTRLDGLTKQHQQINWPVAQPSINLSAFASHKPSPNPILGANIYDRLAHAVLHLSRAKKTPPVSMPYADTSENVTPVSCSPTASSSPRHSDTESDARNNGGSEDVVASSPQVKREVVGIEPMIRNKRTRLESNEVELTRPSMSSNQLDDVLEISVPRMISSVVIVKGNSRITVDLD